MKPTGGGNIYDGGGQLLRRSVGFTHPSMIRIKSSLFCKLIRFVSVVSRYTTRDTYVRMPRRLWVFSAIARFSALQLSVIHFA